MCEVKALPAGTGFIMSRDSAVLAHKLCNYLTHRNKIQTTSYIIKDFRQQLLMVIRRKLIQISYFVIGIHLRAAYQITDKKAH